MTSAYEFVPYAAMGSLAVIMSVVSISFSKFAAKLRILPENTKQAEDFLHILLVVPLVDGDADDVLCQLVFPVIGLAPFEDVGPVAGAEHLMVDEVLAQLFTVFCFSDSDI